MRTPDLLPSLLCLHTLLAPAPVFADAVQHSLQARIDPPAHRLEVRDRITLPEGVPDALTLRLHAGLSPRLIGEGATLAPATEPAAAGVPVEAYRLLLEPGVRDFTLSYAGEIHHPIEDQGEEYARSFRVSPGIIGSEGVFLSGASRWISQIEGLSTLSFEMTVSLPEGWRSVSQGRRADRTSRDGQIRETWREASPQEEIYLVAAPLTEYRRSGAGAEALVFLREPEEALARRYLELTERYLRMYEQLIGPYPYAKFALVENFWDTGYGMPSFTLLGPRVIRLPFIPYTSYPHEILHNWWGNGVYVDFDSGNWSEGLTSYLADHLMKEQRGQGAEYRRSTLQKFADYVDHEEDFPLTDFRGRHSSVTEAVGYGKTLMVFHMLRRRLGDRAFVAGLRRFYQDNVFRVAAWSDLAAAFDAVADEPLDAFFEQWTTRSGAPELRLRDAVVEEDPPGFRLRAFLEQTQDAPPYALRVPVAVQVEGREKAIPREIAFDGREQELEMELPARPLHLAVDPAFDLFRRLHREEIPAAISQALGSAQVSMVLPSAAPEPLRKAYAELVRSWQRGRDAEVQTRRDDELQALAEDRVVWLLGWENRFRPALDEALASYDFVSEPDRVTLAGETLHREEHAVVVVARRKDNPDLALAWVASDNVAAMRGLAQKLPHYGKYSYLGFAGDEPDNVLKGQWPVAASPLSASLAAGPVAAPRMEPRKALAELPPAFSAERMMADVNRLADSKLEGRGLGSPGLEAAAEYIAEQFRKIGLEPVGDPGEGYFQTWRSLVGDADREVTLRNIVGVLAGGDAEQKGQRVVVGAHYDHLGRGWPDVREGNAGKVHPGADDNASGVAVLLELARVLADGPPPDRAIVFAAFTGEEADRLGSRHYVETSSGQPGHEVVGMINLDTVGRLEEGPLYVLGTGSAREWPYVLRGAGHVTGVRVEPVTEPLDSSDQTSFIESGVPAVQLFSGAHADYHRPSDTADKVDAEGMVRVAAVAREVIDYLAGRDGHLTAVNGAPSSRTPKASRPARRAALGTVPDFSHSGEGVRLSGVSPGSPAEKAGLREGDVLVSLNDQRIDTLSEYADILRGLGPGDAVKIRFLRDGELRTIETQLVPR